MNDEYELNFIKIDSDNNIKLIGTDDLELEMLDLMTCVSPFEMESIDGILHMNCIECKYKNFLGNLYRKFKTLYKRILN